MLNKAALCACIVLESFLLVRGARTSLCKKFPLFYSYIAGVLTRDLFGTIIYVYYPSFYTRFYWSTELVVGLISCGVLVEIYTQSFKNRPGLARFFRALLLILFLAMAVKAALGWLGNAQMSPVRAIAGLEGNLRQLQAGLLICLLALLVYYGIGLGRNLSGLALGYALFIAADVITATFMADPNTGFALLMRKIEPLSYLVALVIWSFALWVPRPESTTNVSYAIEENYERLARETRIMLLRARTHLARMTRL